MDKGTYTYNPRPDFMIEKGTILILLGTSDDVLKFRENLLKTIT
jgi:uncharacterized protein with PhoU and TrkA domain